MEFFQTCLECQKTREVLADLVMVLAYNRRLVELWDGHQPMDLDDAVISCKRCGTTGRILTVEGRALLAVLEERIVAKLEVEMVQRGVTNDPT